MKYSIKAHETIYKGVTFRSRLEARWAAFFDLAGWLWEYEPIDLAGWSPDFRVEIPCGHSECPGKHVLLGEVKPYFDIRDFDNHPCVRYAYGRDNSSQEKYSNDDYNIPADASAAFGATPYVTFWVMVHGAGGGEYTVQSFIHNYLIDSYWNEAGKVVQYRKDNR